MGILRSVQQVVFLRQGSSLRFSLPVGLRAWGEMEVRHPQGEKLSQEPDVESVASGAQIILPASRYNRIFSLFIFSGFPFGHAKKEEKRYKCEKQWLRPRFETCLVTEGF